MILNSFCGVWLHGKMVHDALRRVRYHFRESVVVVPMFCNALSITSGVWRTKVVVDQASFAVTLSMSPQNFYLCLR